jgi:hypothetical protein
MSSRELGPEWGFFPLSFRMLRRERRRRERPRRVSGSGALKMSTESREGPQDRPGLAKEPVRLD